MRKKRLGRRGTGGVKIVHDEIEKRVYIHLVKGMKEGMNE